MLRTLTDAVVHVIAIGGDDPLIPLDVLEVDVQVSLAADGHIFPTSQGALL